MFKGLGDMAGLMRQAQEMQGRMKEMQDRLATMKVEGTAGGGMVKVTASGAQKVLACAIEPSLLASGDAEVLQDLIVAATNQALDNAREAAATEMQTLTGGINLPGLGDALGKFGFNQ